MFKITIKSLQLLLKEASKYNFLIDIWTFIKRPEIYNGDDEYVPLKTCFANLFKSIAMASLLVALISKLLTNKIPMANLFTVFDSTSYYIMILWQCAITGLMITILFSMITFQKEKKVLVVFLFQVIQAYAVLNIILIPFLYLGINYVILDSFGLGYTSLNIALLIYSFTMIFMVFRLIINPVRQCLQKYYSRRVAFLISFSIYGLSLFTTSLFPSNSENHGISITGFCESYASMYQSSQQMISQPEQRIIERCMNSL
ncbi:MAG: hypothetical protein WAK61_16980 [Leclercia sp.]